MRPNDVGLINVYVKHYQGQRGGGFPVFQGTTYQRGAGLGDILRAVARFFFPIATSAAKQFVTSTSDAINEGKSFREAAKGALAPTLSTGLGAASEAVANKFQKGSGRRKRRVYKKAKAVTKNASKRKRTTSKKNRGNKSKKSHKIIRLLNSNF